MKKIAVPDHYTTFINEQREVLKRGDEYNLEKHNSKFIVRKQVWEYSDALMSLVERLPDHQGYLSFATLEEAQAQFNRLEGKR